jgi:hypothetical protein
MSNNPFHRHIIEEPVMLSNECVRELHTAWLPNITDSGLDRLIDLLEKGSPFLIHGSFTRAVPMGCLATHIAWNHPHTAKLNMEAGITWLHWVAGLNPATSCVIREWDRRGSQDWEIRSQLLEIFASERLRRQEQISTGQPERTDYKLASLTHA